MYTDTKSSYDFVKEPVQSAEDPELILLHRKLRIQKDRLVSWGLEWSDPSQSPDIDESINKAGLSELVGSVMSTIKEILAEAEPLWQSSKRTDEKTPVSGKSIDRKQSLITWDKSRFEDLVRDLTMSIDTLYDLSRTRQSARKASVLKASEESSSPLQTKSPVLEERQFESTRMQTPHQIDPASIIWPRDLKSMQPGMLSPAKAPRQIVFMRRPTSLLDARKMGSLPTVPVLLEQAPYDPIYSITGITPSMTRFEKLFAALSQAYISSDRLLSGLLRLIGYFEEAEHSRFCLLYALPTHFGPVDIENPRMPAVSILSDLLCSHNYEPSLEVKYRLAYNVANAVFDLHSKGVVHGNVVSSNILFIEHLAQTRSRMDLTQVNMRQSFLTSFDLFSDNATDSSAPTAQLSLYRHALDPCTTRYTRLTSDSKSLDLYGLAILLLEIGLWTTIDEIFPHMPALPQNPLAVFKQLASRCGSLYMKAVQACWNSPEDELSQRARPDVMHQKVFWKVSKALDACCAIDEASDDENESDDSPPIPSSPLRSSLLSTPVRRNLRDQKPPLLPTLSSSASSDRQVDWSEKPLLQSYIKSTSSLTEKADWSEKQSSAKPSSMYVALPPELHLIVAAPVQQTSKSAKPKLRTYPAIRISQEHLDYWHTGIMPHINHVLRGFYKKYPESVEISLESIGESSTTTKPTILVICTSVNKVRSILKKSLVYDKSVYGLKVCRGKVVRSRKNGVKRSMAVSGDVKPANGDHQERPSNGASIGAYVGERHLAPVSFGGLIMVDDKPYGMTVHHMLDDPSDDEEFDTNAPILRSSAHPFDMPDLTRSESSVYSSGDEEYMYELSDYESDFSSDAGNEAPEDESEGDEEEDGSESGLEPGDIKGIPRGCGEEYLVTQPAIDDVDDDFYPSLETKDEDHLDSFGLGEIYASSGIRRRVEDDIVHEIDWALFEFKDNRCPEKNHIENGQRFCTAKNYPATVAPTSDLSDLQVHCMARTSGLQSGRILPGMVIVKIYGRQTPSSSYQVAGKLGVPGDSGAWVVDNEQGRACGHVLAWSSKKKVAYICPMAVLLRDVGETLQAKSISFPGGEEVYSPTSLSTIPTLHTSTESAAASVAVDVTNELSTMLKELNLAPTPSEIDGISPTAFHASSHDENENENLNPTFVPIRLMTKTDDVKMASISRHQHLNFVQAPGMEWGAEEVGTDVGVGLERGDRLDRVDRVERAVHPA